MTVWSLAETHFTSELFDTDPPPDETLMRHVPSHLEFWHLITRGPRARDLGSASWNLSK